MRLKLLYDLAYTAAMEELRTFVPLELSILIRTPLVPELATVATVSTVILSTVATLVALAVLWPARLPTIAMVSGGCAEANAQPESASAHRAHDRGPRHSSLQTHCCAPSVL